MAGMVANLSDADMRAVAAYYAAQKLRPAAAADKELAAPLRSALSAARKSSPWSMNLIIPHSCGWQGPTRLSL
jgi:hypothetical protein